MIVDSDRSAAPWSRPLAAIILVLASAGPALAASAAADAPPSPAQIKACVQQFDMGKNWRFDWKVVDVGPPRHPQNNLEALGSLGGGGQQDRYGYPVHVVYTLNGATTIDAQYWIMRNARGAWQIPAICTLP
jgi:hypothetical protein